jgi:hypothetical protein
MAKVTGNPLSVDFHQKTLISPGHLPIVNPPAGKGLRILGLLNIHIAAN